MSIRIALPLLFIINSLISINGLQMAVEYGSKKCFKYFVPLVTEVYASFEVASGATPMHIDLFVNSEKGDLILHKTGITFTKFTIPAEHQSRKPEDPKDGEYSVEELQFCLVHHVQPHEARLTGVRRVSFNIQVEQKYAKKWLVQAKDVSEKTKKINAVEKSLGQVIDGLDQIKELEAHITKVNDATSRQVVIVNSLTCVVIAIVGLLQFDFMKSSLKSAKAIS